MSRLLQAAGWDKLLTFDNRVTAMQFLAAHEAFYKRKLSIDQFCDGLAALGLLNVIRSHPELMRPFLTQQRNPVDTSTSFGPVSQHRKGGGRRKRIDTTTLEEGHL